jgi:hypothetical protein
MEEKKQTIEELIEVEFIENGLLSAIIEEESKNKVNKIMDQILNKHLKKHLKESFKKSDKIISALKIDIGEDFEIRELLIDLTYEVMYTMIKKFGDMEVNTPEYKIGLSNIWNYKKAK